MRIAAESTIAACERALAEIERSGEKESLKLPTNIKHLAGGGEANLAQVIITWAQHVRTRKLETYISDLGDDQVKKFTRRLPGMVAALCADTISDVGGHQSISEKTQVAALSRLDVLQGSRPKAAYRGSAAEVLCADHLGRNAPYLLYRSDSSGDTKLRSREQYRDLANWLLKTTIPKTYRQQFDTEAARAIGGMLYEIFQNTEDHALVDSNGDVLDISFRGIKTDHLSVRPEALKDIVEDFEPLASYCKTLRPPNDATHTQLFELSVFDSGPGFAVSWTGKELNELSDEQEETAVRECFGKGSAKGESRFGQGLPHVMRILQRQGGFLRLRTGRLSLFADFSMPEQKADSLQAIRRWDPVVDSSLAPVAGSLITIMLPLRR